MTTVAPPSSTGTRFVRHFSWLRSQECLCDFTLIAAEGERFSVRVHRVVLAACSKYLEELFQTIEEEGRENSLVLENVTKVGLNAIIDFAYDGHLELDLKENGPIVDICRAATNLHVDAAIAICHKFLIDSVTIENSEDVDDVFDKNIEIVFNIATKSSMTETRRRVLLEYMISFDILDDEEIFEIKFEEFADILESNSNQVESEFDALKMVLHWVKHDVKNRGVHLAALVSRVRLPLLTDSELKEVEQSVEQFKELISYAECRELLAEARDYQSQEYQQPFIQTSRTQVRGDKPSFIYSLPNGEVKSLTESHGRKTFDLPMTLTFCHLTVVDNFVYVCGTVENSDIPNQHFRYDPRSNRWLTLQPMPRRKKSFAYLAHNNCIYTIGGENENPESTVEKFSIEHNRWETCSPLPYGVHNHAAAVLQDRIYISGGLQYFDKNFQDTAGVASYDPRTNEWTEENTLNTGRFDHSMVTVGTRLYVIGGEFEIESLLPNDRQHENYSFVETIETFSMTTGVWTTCQAKLECSRVGAFADDGYIYIIPGRIEMNRGEYTETKPCIYSPDGDCFVYDRDPVSSGKSDYSLWVDCGYGDHYSVASMGIVYFKNYLEYIHPESSCYTSSESESE